MRKLKESRALSFAVIAVIYIIATVGFCPFTNISKG